MQLVVRATSEPEISQLRETSLGVGNDVIEFECVG